MEFCNMSSQKGVNFSLHLSYFEWPRLNDFKDGLNEYFPRFAKATRSENLSDTGSNTL